MALLVAFIWSSSANAYKADEARKIAAPVDTAIAMLLGYNSRTGNYAEQCLKSVSQRRTGQSPPADANFKMVSSMNEFTRDRSFDLAVAMKANFAITSVSGSVDTSFEEKMRKKVESKAAYARFSDLAAPVFVAPNAKFELNQRGEEALAAAAKGRVQRFERECGDSVIIGFQKGRYFTGVGTLSNISSFKSREQDTKVKLAARYMAVKMSASVQMGEQETEDAEELSIEIDYSMSGDTRVKGATNFRQLRRAFRQFQARPLSETQTYQYVYVIPIKDLVSTADFDFGLSPQQARKVQTIINGLGVLASAKNVARIEKRKGSGGPNKDQRKVSRAYKALNTEFGYLVGQLRKAKFCLRGVNKPCRNMYERFINYPDSEKRGWLKPFINNAYASTEACNWGYPVSTPTGRRLCKQCSLGREPTFINGKEGACSYIAKAKPGKKNKRLWAHELKISSAKGGSDSGSALDVYPDFCVAKNTGCGQKAANKLCQQRGLGKAKKFKKWDWRPNNPIHSNRFITHYGNGKKCSVKKDSFSGGKCRTFKYIDCAKT